MPAAAELLRLAASPSYRRNPCGSGGCDALPIWLWVIGLLVVALVAAVIAYAYVGAWLEEKRSGEPGSARLRRKLRRRRLKRAVLLWRRSDR